MAFVLYRHLQRGFCFDLASTTKTASSILVATGASPHARVTMVKSQHDWRTDWFTKQGNDLTWGHELEHLICLVVLWSARRDRITVIHLSWSKRHSAFSNVQEIIWCQCSVAAPKLQPDIWQSSGVWGHQLDGGKTLWFITSDSWFLKFMWMH